jgi:hypothetical protein
VCEAVPYGDRSLTYQQILYENGDGAKHKDMMDRNCTSVISSSQKGGWWW